MRYLWQEFSGALLPLPLPFQKDRVHGFAVPADRGMKAARSSAVCGSCDFCAALQCIQSWHKLNADKFKQVTECSFAQIQHYV